MATKPKATKFAKHSKKGWRRVNIDDVEDFLEDERIQERTGGLASEKADDQLFHIDTIPTGKTAKEPQKQVTENPNADLRRSQRILQTPLKKHALLDISSHIKAVKSGTPKAPPKTDTLPYSTEKKLKRKIGALERAAECNKKAKTEGSETYDMWAEEKKGGVNDYYDLITKRKRVKRPKAAFKKPSHAPSVTTPHPGLSYNPAFEHHQELLQEAATAEIKRIEKEKRRRRKAKLHYTRGGRPEEDYIEEMSAGLFMDDDDEDEDEVAETSSGDEQKLRKPVKAKGKREKAHDRRTKELKLAKLKRLEERKLLASYDRIPSTNKKIILEIQDHKKELAQKSEERTKRKMYGTKRLNKTRFEDLEPQVALTSELRGTMRKIAPTFSSLLEDRFKSLQRRNIIEPRELLSLSKPKGRKRKYVEKRNYRNLAV